MTSYTPLSENNLNDFTKVNGTADYTLENGILTGISKNEKRNSFLALNREFTDFILKVDVKIDMGLTSGIQFRSHVNPDSLNGRLYGYQVEIGTSDRKWAGGIYEEAGRGWLYILSDNKIGQNAWKNNEWNHCHIEAIGDTITTWINDIPTAYLIDNKESSGLIAFQVHGMNQESLKGKKVQWKNIEIYEGELNKLSKGIPNNIHQTDLTKM